MDNIISLFPPLRRSEMDSRGWDVPDFVYVTGDAYVDHPSFGAAVICRVLQNAGFRIAVLSQPDWHSAEPFTEFGCPRLGFLVSSGNIDSMVAHYTVSKKRRTYDYYTPGGAMGKRPDRAVIVYCNRIREAYGDIPVIIGGLEASLRRFAHYDYWDNTVRRSILLDSRADILSYGMGENTLLRIAFLLNKGVPVSSIRDVRGTCYVAAPDDKIHYEVAGEFDFGDLKNSRKKYAEAFGVQYKNQDAITGKAIIERYGNRVLVANPPMPPLEREELDKVYALPFTRQYHPDYEKDGGVPGLSEVKFSITHNRGCYGECNFCALTFHQGRSVRSRSIESVVAEAKKLTEFEDFKGYIHDIGGPTANFRAPACEKQLKSGTCTNKRCLAPKPCPNLKVDHSDYIRLIEEVEAIPKIKKVFIRSGIRFDYLMLDKNDAFFRKLVKDNVSGQLKVAPEHCSASVLSCMGKADFSIYESFRKKYFELCRASGKEQYIVPYLMSSHPGSTLNSAIELALMLKRDGCNPEQVQDFYPTPGTASTVMYYTGLDPLTMKPVYVATDPREKQLQRALLQFKKPENAPLVREALKKCGREDLIGNAPSCLVRPDNRGNAQSKKNGYHQKEKSTSKSSGSKNNKVQNHPKSKAKQSPRIKKGR